MTRRARSSPRGFTLIEALVAIVVVAVLISLFLPTLAGTRQQAKLSGEGQLARQLSLALAMYQSDNQEMFPFFGTPGDPIAYPAIDGVELTGGLAEAPVRFFSYHRWYWASAIYPGYLDMPRSDLEPEGVTEFFEFLGWPDSVVAATFQMVSVAFARPAFWSGSDSVGHHALDNVQLIQPTYLADVRYPSQKGILGKALFGVHAGMASSEMTIAAGDSSVRIIGNIDVFLGEPVNSVKRPWGATGYNIDSTIDGLAGVDF